MDSNSVEKIENIIIRVIKDNIGIEIEDKKKNLFCTSYGIEVADMLYIIDDLEKEFNLSLAKIFEKEDYTFFTLEGLAKDIYELEKDVYNLQLSCK